MKVAINKGYGGSFAVSEEFCSQYRKKTGKKFDNWDKENRTDPVVIELIESMGDAANGFYAKLLIVEIPDDVKWYIDEYDGDEIIREEHRTWGDVE